MVSSKQFNKKSGYWCDFCKKHPGEIFFSPSFKYWEYGFLMFIARHFKSILTYAFEPPRFLIDRWELSFAMLSMFFCKEDILHTFFLLLLLMWSWINRLEVNRFKWVFSFVCLMPLSPKQWTFHGNNGEFWICSVNLWRRNVIFFGLLSVNGIPVFHFPTDLLLRSYN